MNLYGYWRSSCSWRVRIALAYKGLSYHCLPVHLVQDGGQQHAAAHRERNPMGQVPVLETDDGWLLTQSMAIMEYLEEIQPNPTLLPGSAKERARVRQLAEMINAGIQPLQNLAVLQHLGKLEAINPKAWAKHYISTGLDALETTSKTSDSTFLVGNSPTFADLCLIPQLYNARRFECDTGRWPKLLQAETAANALESFQLSHPDNQPDAAKPA